MERDEFIKIVRENQNMIFKICLSYCKDPEDRKDLQQDILLTLWRSLDKFDGRAKMSTWIYRIALNTAISFYRSEFNKLQRTTPLDTMIITLPEIEEPESGYEENIRILYKFIEQQNELDKALLLLYLDDIKYSEIATIIGISETNVATKLNRLKKRIKTYFEQF